MPWLLQAGRPRPGETLVVSAAAGAVGSLVAQYGKKAGCKVIGIAGGPSKCSFLVDKLGLDAAVDYKAFPSSDALAAEIHRLTGGVDVYFGR
jgi:NADPH-dependent curcumin reductase CurA